MKKYKIVDILEPDAFYGHKSLLIGTVGTAQMHTSPHDKDCLAGSFNSDSYMDALQTRWFYFACVKLEEVE